MASTGTNGGNSLPHDFFLTPHQQNLLFAALNTNNQGGTTTSQNNGVTLSPSSFKGSPIQSSGGNMSTQESPYLDNYDYDFGDNSFDFSFASGDQSKMIGDLPDTARSESTDHDSTDKRTHPDDEEDTPGNDSKRRESSDKLPKKPGRKPLTSEPTSKRKAQNRAAQRAFRERKEKHLKDLEDKIEELEKASETTNKENNQLRAQVERMTAELIHYKSTMSMLSQNKPATREKSSFGSAAVNNLNDVNFQFEFPKFGSLPGPAPNTSKRSPSQPISPQQNGVNSTSPPRVGSKSSTSAQQAAQNAQFKEDLAKFSNIFTPSMGSSTGNGSRASLDSSNHSLGGATSSPSSSSNYNAGASSSCGTSPEPFTQSPMVSKPLEAMSTIGEEQSSLENSQQQVQQFQNSDAGIAGLDWLSQQNGGQFDPQLFGGYREPQENILSNPSFDDFFNDAFDADFFTPYNVAPTPNPPKKGLMADLEAKQRAVEDDVVKEQAKGHHQFWEKLQNCPTAQSGEFDLDGLCSELTSKAKCSGNGPVVKGSDFDTILQKYMGKDVSSDSVANKLGIEVSRAANKSIAPTTLI